MSTEWGLLPLGIDETDLVMLLLALFILSLLVIGMFIVFPLFYALLGTLLIILGILYGVRTLKSKQDSSD
ncbi:MAG: hypothetical protein ThorAB25_24150 [Candidatus Thorarchaeota archaeon AB_25]|nr:MAG: hypothetical protein ThorAB25_24150 [Candidatus Thorarchaeota archaeon AB_25]